MSDKRVWQQSLVIEHPDVRGHGTTDKQQHRTLFTLDVDEVIALLAQGKVVTLALPEPLPTAVEQTGYEYWEDMARAYLVVQSPEYPRTRRGSNFPERAIVVTSE